MSVNCVTAFEFTKQDAEKCSYSLCSLTYDLMCVYYCDDSLYLTKTEPELRFLVTVFQTTVCLISLLESLFALFFHLFIDGPFMVPEPVFVCKM